MSLVIGETYSEVVFRGVGLDVLNGLSKSVLSEDHLRNYSQTTDDGYYVVKVEKRGIRGLIVEIYAVEDMDILYSGVHPDVLEGDVYHFEKPEGGLHSVVLRVV